MRFDERAQVQTNDLCERNPLSAFQLRGQAEVNQVGVGRTAHSLRQEDWTLHFSSTMEVDILISSPIDTIVSPVNLAGAIGIPPGVHLRLCRDPTNSGKSRLIVRCDKRTASNLRHRFSNLSPYAHEGHMTSLKIVGVRPIFPPREEDPGDLLPGGSRDGTSVPAVEGRSKASAEPSSTSSSAGVEHALDIVGLEADGLLRDVPGVHELHYFFLRTSTGASSHSAWKRTRKKHLRSRDEEEKQGGFETVDECNSDTSTVSEETKRSSSSDRSRRRAMYEFRPSGQRRRRQPQRHHKNTWREEHEKMDELRNAT